MKPIWEIVGIAVDAHYCGQTRDVTRDEKRKNGKGKRIKEYDNLLKYSLTCRVYVQKRWHDDVRRRGVARTATQRI